jgi:DNA-binding MarR family transcriptional regulator
VAVPDEDADSYRQEVLALLRACNDLLMLAEPNLFRLYHNTGLTVTQLRILRLLREGPIQAGLLAGLVGISAPSLTRILKRVAELGLVSTKVNRLDRRRVEVAITREGLSLLSLQPLLRGSAFELAAAAMTPEDRAGAIAMLRKLRDQVRAQMKVATPTRPLTVARATRGSQGAQAKPR